VFFVIGLWKGLWWQVSRVIILLVAYYVATRFGGEVGQLFLRWTVNGAPTPEQQDTALYAAYVLTFLAILVALSLWALLLQKLIKRAGLSFFDRAGGGVVGIGTGAGVMLFLLSALYMFFPESQVAQAAVGSHAGELSQRAVDLFGKVVPDEVRRAFHLPPLRPPAAADQKQAPANPATGDKAPVQGNGQPKGK